MGISDFAGVVDGAIAVRKRRDGCGQSTLSCLRAVLSARRAAGRVLFIVDHRWHGRDRLLVEEGRHTLPLPGDAQGEHDDRIMTTTSTAGALPRRGFVLRPLIGHLTPA